MTARVVFVNDGAEQSVEAMDALQNAGYETQCYSSSMDALLALEKDHQVDLLITKARFPAGQPNGLSLAFVAKQSQPDLKVLFLVRPAYVDLVKGVGDYLVLPRTMEDLLKAIAALIGPPDTINRKP